MKLFSIQLLRQDEGSDEPQTLVTVFDLSSFGYFQRSPAREMMTFVAKTIVQRTPAGQRASVMHEGYYCHVYIRRDGLSVLTVADNEYPSRAAFALMNKLLDEYDREMPTSKTWPVLENTIIKYQDPTQADQILAIQKELDETKEVLAKTIENVLAREEKLDELVAKSRDLSVQSRVLYREARGMNSCCIMM